jgi:hypothetical protein
MPAMSPPGSRHASMASLRSGPSPAPHAWLSITPEPERELPAAIATLRSGGSPPRELVEREEARAERLVTRGSHREWRAYLEEAVLLARSAGADEDVDPARSLVEDVVANHDNLALGLTPRKRGPA